MNKNQINEVQKYVDLYDQIDMSELLANWANSHNLSENDDSIVQFSAKEFLSLSNKVINQFKAELKTSFLKSLPFQYQFHNEFGGGDLISDLSNFIAFCEKGQFKHALGHLNRLVHYQSVNGFWEKSKRKYFRSSEESINDEKERIALASKLLNASVENYKHELNEIRLLKKELSEFLNKKTATLSEIDDLLLETRAEHESVSNLREQSAVISEKISSLAELSEVKQSEIDEVMNSAKQDLKDLKKSISTIENATDKTIEEYTQLKDTFNKSVEYVESKKDYFEERNSYLNDLIGREVGASLFETFKQRKEELSKPILFWVLAIPVTTIGTIIWLFTLFGNGDLSSLGWQVILINTLKGLPAIGLLLFTIAQYSKERNFQEEYAFKSAVALTLNAYADQLERVDNKDQLILDSVKSIYKAPFYKKINDKSENNVIKQSLDDLKELIKSFVKK